MKFNTLAKFLLAAAGNVVQGASTYGHLAVGVPGTVSGMEFARVLRHDEA
jgi:gamma-glutamyltranspeptidase/glutathione hydrolase